MVLARPTAGLLALGAVLAAFGVAVRGWAAGCIRKERELTTAGPYAHTRNPLYLGSLLIGLGVTVAGGRWEFLALFGLLFVWVYGRTIRAEAHHLEQVFGERYAAMRARCRSFSLVLCRTGEGTATFPFGDRSRWSAGSGTGNTRRCSVCWRGSPF